MPEAYNYLRIDGKIIDCTRKGSSENDFVNELAEEIEINPNQITDFKVQYHQEFLKKYLLQHPEIQYSLEKFWKIREECIFLHCNPKICVEDICLFQRKLIILHPVNQPLTKDVNVV